MNRCISGKGATPIVTPLVKLCGLSRPTDIEQANQIQPDFIGFVFAQKSIRNIHPEQAGKLRQQLDPNIAVVGVFVNEDPQLITRMVNDQIIDYVQLHGTEDTDYLQHLRTLTPAPVIKAYQINQTTDLESVWDFPADHLLLDSGAGTGEVFNWEILSQVDKPYFLAGGLNVENVQAAIGQLQPYAVDVSSGIETPGKPGVKDPERMTEFVRRVRSPAVQLQAITRW